MSTKKQFGAEHDKPFTGIGIVLGVDVAIELDEGKGKKVPRKVVAFIDLAYAS